MQHLFPVCLLALSILVVGCGKGGGPAPGANGNGANGGDDSASNPANPGQNGGEKNQVSANYSRYATAARETARLLGEMSSEYESLANSGKSSISIERTPKLNEQLDGATSNVRSMGAPAVADARKLKTDVLPSLVSAIKTAQLAETHLEQKYRTMFSFGRSSRISDGIRTANRLLTQFQRNLSASERLTLGAPPTVGGRPFANVSYGELANMGFDPVSYRAASRGGATKESIPWQVTVDSSKQDFSLPADVRLNIEVPHAAVAVRGSSRTQPVKIVYPATPSSFVAVGLNQVPAQSRHVWDLKTRKRVGSIKGLQMGGSRHLALSPDGKFFAGRPAGANLIGIWDVAARKAVKTVRLPVAGEPSLLEFAADNRIVAVVGNMLYVLSTPSGALLHQLDMSRPVPTSSFYCGYTWAISPGGKYLAISNSSGKDILFVDVTTGKKVGRLDVSKESFVSWIALDFSDDGKQLGVVIDGSFGSWVQTWGVAQGRVVSTFKLSQPLNKLLVGERNYQGPGVDWFPDGQRLLIYGRGIFNTATGEIEKALPATTVYRLRPLDVDHLVIVEKTKLAPYDLSQVAPTGVNASRQATPSTDPIPILGQKQPPKLTESDRSKLVFQKIDGPATWQVEADSASPATIGDVKIAGFSNKANIVHAAIAASGKRAAVGYSSVRLSINRGKVSADDSTKTWIEHAQLSASAAPQRFDFDRPMALQAISPAGDLVCTKFLKDLGQIDIWNLDSQQHIVGFKPYEQDVAVIWADFVDEQRLLTLAPGRLTMWQIPECLAVWEMQLNTKTRPALSPGRRYLAMSSTSGSGEACVVINCADGTIAGKTAMKEKTGTISAIEFANGGNRIAIVSADGLTGHVTSIDSSSGKIDVTFPIPLAGQVVQSCGRDHVLIDGAYLVDIPQQACAWLYKLGKGIHIADSPDGRHWYFAGGEKAADPATLLAVALPDSTATTALSGGKLKSKIVLQPGGRIGFDIKVLQPPGQSNFSQQVITTFKNSFQAAGITVDSSAPVKLVVRGTTGKTGRGLSNDRDEVEVVWTVSIQRGKDILWRQTRRATSSGFVSVDRNLSGAEREAQAARKLTERMWKNASSYLLNFSLPAYVFNPEAGQGLGSSQLTANGAEN